MEINKKVNLDLVGLDGNAFNLIGKFRARAIKENWTEEEIEYVTNQCMSGNYDNLLRTLIKYTEHSEEQIEPEE